MQMALITSHHHIIIPSIKYQQNLLMYAIQFNPVENLFAKEAKEQCNLASLSSFTLTSLTLPTQHIAATQKIYNFLSFLLLCGYTNQKYYYERHDMIDK